MTYVHLAHDCHIGDDVTLNAGSVLQAHSLEDGAFKSDHIVIGPGVTIGPRGFVHYGVTVHEGAMLDWLKFSCAIYRATRMKERLPAMSRLAAPPGAS